MIKVNEYYEGRVKSLGNQLNGQSFSVGIILAGEYTFGTQTEELMEIVMGEMEVIHPDQTRKTYRKGESFTVPPGREFSVVAKAPVSYLCIYR